MKKMITAVLPAIVLSVLFSGTAVHASQEEPFDFQEVTVIDNDECSIVLTDIENDDIWGFTIHVLLENRSSDKTYMFYVESASVNGVQQDPFFSSEVAPGKKANESITFSDMEEYGIDSFTDIEMNFMVYDSDDWMADAAGEESVHVYPYGEDKAVRYVREPLETDIVLADNEYASVIVTDIYEDDFWGYTLGLYIENRTDTSILVGTEDESINGYMADPFFAVSVKAGKCEFTTLSWSDSELEENGISEVEEIEFLLKVYDDEDWSADEFISEPIIINP